MSYTTKAQPSWPGQKRGFVMLPFNMLWCETQPLLAPLLPTGSSSWTTANTAVGFWITPPETVTVYRIGWYNGSSPAGDVDVGIYDSDGTTKLVSTGVTTCTTVGNAQFVDTTDTVLYKGKRYFVAMNASSTGGKFGANSANTSLAAQLFAEVKVQAVGATALPDPFVPADPAAVVFINLIVLQTRTVY